MATAKLHTLVQTRRHATIEESAYLLFFLDGVVQEALKGRCLSFARLGSETGTGSESVESIAFPAADNQEHYSFLIPVTKALVERLSSPLCVPQYCLDLPSTSVGPVFFEEFQSYCKCDQWRQFMEQKVG